MKALLVIYLFTVSCSMLPSSKAKRSFASEEKGEKQPTYSQYQNLEPQVRRVYETQPQRVKKEDFNPDNFNDGSLWREKGQVNYLFTENRVRNVGDILTIKVEKDMREDIVEQLREHALTKAYKRRLEFRKKRLERRKRALAKASGSKNKDLAEKSKQALETTKEGEAKEAEKAKKESEKLDRESDIVLVEVVDRFANGSYRVKGVKEVLFRGKKRALEVSGLVQDKDITNDSVVKSSDVMASDVRYLR